MRLLILGGGASGLLAALTAAERPGTEITVLERQSRVGRKLAATGNGRCNLTNRTPGRYHGGDPGFAAPALRAFGPDAVCAYLEGLGLETAAEPSGRVYPFSDQAGSVVDTLRLALEQTGARVELGAEALSLQKRDGVFFAETAAQRFAADRVIVACGGAAGGKLGGTTSGYALLQSFGHRCTKLRPSLVQLKAEGVRALKGVRAQAEVRLLQDGRVRASASGEVQFTEYGLSGPCIFDLSRAVSDLPGAKTAVLDLLPPRSEAALAALLRARAARFPALTMENFLTGTLQNRLGRTVLLAAGYRLDAPLSSLRAEDCARIAAAVKAFALPVSGTLGMDQAQVTAGGIETAGFDPETLESRLCPGLYACGEVLDIDGDCGGYNLQWAWASGRLAGQTKGKNR